MKDISNGNCNHFPTCVTFWAKVNKEYNLKDQFVILIYKQILFMDAATSHSKWFFCAKIKFTFKSIFLK